MLKPTYMKREASYSIAECAKKNRFKNNTAVASTCSGNPKYDEHNCEVVATNVDSKCSSSSTVKRSLSLIDLLFFFPFSGDESLIALILSLAEVFTTTLISAILSLLSKNQCLNCVDCWKWTMQRFLCWSNLAINLTLPLQIFTVEINEQKMKSKRCS